ncbi:sulfite exporter TauE/SafE family protein [Microcella humidisoli]|uniref:Probable membrane transporter protein n=1 Tax=Microcella humidisoli TaxID=2963406 RepID=A0ABY5FXW8_9MICO|nr:sulfite exporter TauE/SafE family protein [Microcella humidisoli]UTT63159.1 sulfite exporter TauE/SafE family protein [Microcella humidisoli]
MILPLLAIGAIGGLFSGLFGVGGGFIMVPLMMAWLRFDQRRASATSLLAIIPPAALSASLYGARGQIDLLAAAIIAVGAIAGTPLGALLLRRLSLVWLKWLFIAGLLATALRLVVVAPERSGVLEYGVVTVLGLVALGVLMGVLAGLLGVGGGIVAVPVLIAVFGVGDLLAKGTSLLAMIPGAIAGTATNLRAGLVQWRESATIGAAAAVMSLVGVWLAFLIPPQLAAWLFAALLLGVIVQMALRRVPPRG